MPTSLPKPFAIGRTAEVYAWGDGSILKLYRKGFPFDWVDYEARIGRAVHQSGIPAPEVRDVIEVDGRRGIVYERVNGPDMLEVLARSPLKIVTCARTLAYLHAQMHAVCAPDLPAQRGILERDIRGAANLPEDLRARALKALEALPAGDRLCHGDFHPGNVILTRRGPIVIDWTNASQGHPAADVARTRLLLTVGDPPGAGFKLRLALLGRGIMLREYLRAYRAAAPESFNLSESFLPVIAAARVNENIGAEREKLLKII